MQHLTSKVLSKCKQCTLKSAAAQQYARGSQ